MSNMEHPLQLAGVIRESVVDGPGWRFVVFAQGCPHRCTGCHNPETHDFSGGYTSSVTRILDAAKENPMLHGITLSGGEPFAQAEGFAILAKEAKACGLDVVTYTGYTFESLLDGFVAHPDWRALLEQTDILVDGQFLQEEKSLQLRFRGSKNQRVLDVPASLAEQRAVETTF